MPRQNADLEAIADIMQEAITNLTRAAELLSEKQPGRHAERCVQSVNFEVAQLSAALPTLRDLLRDPREPRGSFPRDLPDRSPLLTGQPSAEA